MVFAILLCLPLLESIAATEPAPYRVGGDVQAPVFLSGPDPEWNKTALRMCLQGMAVLRATVLRDGTVQEVEAVMGLPFGATQDAVRAVEQWRFEPAVLHGEPVDVYHYLTVKFPRWGER